MPIVSSIIVWLLESTLGKALIGFVWNSLSGWLTTLMAKHKTIVTNAAEAKASVAPLKSAVTGKEIGDASDSDLNGIG